jgi:hypothetical protein
VRVRPKLGGVAPREGSTVSGTERAGVAALSPAGAHPRAVLGGTTVRVISAWKEGRAGFVRVG